MAQYKKAIIILGVIGIATIVGIYLYSRYTDLKSKMALVEKELKRSPGKIEMTPLNMQDGDIIFHKSLSPQSMAIQLATHSEYTHCGIVYKTGNDYFIFEAVEPVKLTPLIEWMGRGKGGTFKVKRLKNADQVLTASALQKMKQVGDRFKGKHYDIGFEWSDDKMYCSELIWKIYKEATGLEIGKLQTLRDFDLSSDVVKQKMKERYGKKVPLDEIVISPASIFNSELLTTVR